MAKEQYKTTYHSPQWLQAAVPFEFSFWPACYELFFPSHLTVTSNLFWAEKWKIPGLSQMCLR